MCWTFRIISRLKTLRLLDAIHNSFNYDTYKLFYFQNCLHPENYNTYIVTYNIIDWINITIG